MELSETMDLRDVAYWDLYLITAAFGAAAAVAAADKPSALSSSDTAEVSNT
jgi:hypothetical protein